MNDYALLARSAFDMYGGTNSSWQRIAATLPEFTP